MNYPKDRRKPGSPPRIICDEASHTNPNLNGPCHVFRGAKLHGYGRVRHGSRMVRVHRYCWEREVGPIPPGLVVDHQCRNRGCCNVDHLRVVTYHVNSTENVEGMLWQLNAAKTHCKRGHEFTASNIYHGPTRNRMCRECAIQRSRDARARNDRK